METRDISINKNRSIILASIRPTYSSKRLDEKLMSYKRIDICLPSLDFSVCCILSMNQIIRSCLSG